MVGYEGKWNDVQTASPNDLPWLPSGWIEFLTSIIKNPIPIAHNKEVRKLD